MKPILVIVHQATSNPGQVGTLLAHQEHTLDIRTPSLGQALPETLEHHHAAIIFGGPMSANDEDTLPFIRTELDWIERALDSGKPLLGICLGAQLIAKALGATVAPHPDGIREIGYFPIFPTPEGRSLFQDLHWVYHWHSEGFDVPTGAVCLATGNTFPNQAFRYGDRVYGLQFHPEMTRRAIAHWTTTGAEQLTLPGAQSRREQARHHARHKQATERWLRCFLDLWLHPSASSAALVPERS